MQAFIHFWITATNVTLLTVRQLYIKEVGNLPVCKDDLPAWPALHFKWKYRQRRQHLLKLLTLDIYFWLHYHLLKFYVHLHHSMCWLSYFLFICVSVRSQNTAWSQNTPESEVTHCLARHASLHLFSEHKLSSPFLRGSWWKLFRSYASGVFCFCVVVFFFEKLIWRSENFTKFWKPKMYSSESTNLATFKCTQVLKSKKCMFLTDEIEFNGMFFMWKVTLIKYLKLPFNLSVYWSYAWLMLHNFLTK